MLHGPEIAGTFPANATASIVGSLGNVLQLPAVSVPWDDVAGFGPHDVWHADGAWSRGGQDLRGVSDVGHGATIGGRGRIRLLGPTQVVDAAGRDCTPRGAIRRALLAILVLSSGPCARTRLQDLLWETRSQGQASSSLRNALSVLKKELLPLGDDVLIATGDTVSINRDAIWIDLFEYSRPENTADLGQVFRSHLPDVLEGIDLRGAGSEGFEDWLRGERTYWRERFEALRLDLPTHTRLPRSDLVMRAVGPVAMAASPVDRTAPTASPDSQRIARVGLLPSATPEDNRIARLFADSILDSIATGIRESTLSDIYDYRETGETGGAAGASWGPDILIRMRVFPDDAELSLTFLVYRSSDQRQIWSQSIRTSQHDSFNLDNLVVSGFVNQSVDRVAQILDQNRPGGQGGIGGSPYHALSLMFQLDPDAMQASEARLETAIGEGSDGVYEGLLAYLASFKIGEFWGAADAEAYLRTEALTVTALEKNPFNSLALTAIGHAQGFVLHDFELAGDTLRKAIQANAHQAIAWDHLALHELYCGHYDKALEAARRAIYLGSFSPFRFSYETTVCMAATLQGNYRLAVQFGKRALSRKPNYAAALRYTSASLAHLGDIEEAAQLIARIRVMQPDLSIDWLSGHRFALADPKAHEIIATGLVKAGLS